MCLTEVKVHVNFERNMIIKFIGICALKSVSQTESNATPWNELGEKLECIVMNNETSKKLDRKTLHVSQFYTKPQSGTINDL